MRCLNRNRQTFYYALYQGETPLYDEYNNECGTTVTYGNPVKMSANISAARGTADADLFGINAVYDKTIVTDDTGIPVTESSILWIDTAPVIAQDGTTVTPHDYVVTRIANGLNSVAIAVRKVEVS